MKKFLPFYVAIFMSLFPFAYAQAASATASTCDEVSGLWTGNWFESGCTWQTSGVGVVDGDNIYFNFKIYDGPCGNGQSFTMRGTCVNGQVSLANNNATMPGSITNGKITIIGDGQKAVLNKLV